MSLTVLIEVATMFLIVSYAFGFSFGLKIIREPNAASSADQDLAMIDKVSYYFLINMIFVLTHCKIYVVSY